MSPTALPARITIDFHGEVHPSRTWILGIGDDVVARRVELLAFDGQPAPSHGRGTPVPTLPPLPTAIASFEAECTCPAFCERDHANE
jgi:hypothetical protein